jgi:hypothetical protein
LPDRKQKSHSSDTVPKPTSNAPGRRRIKKNSAAELSDALQRDIADGAARLRREHGSELADTRKADRAAKLFRTAINPPRPVGHPITKEVGTALQMRMQGKPWPEIHLAIWPGFADWDKYERHYRTFSLHRNVRRAAARRGYTIPKKFRPIAKSKKHSGTFAEDELRPELKK